MPSEKSPIQKEVEVLVKDFLSSDQELPDKSGHGVWCLLVIEEITSTWFPGAGEEFFFRIYKVCVL